MPKSATCLLVGSAEAYCGKSAVILGMAHLLQNNGLGLAYGKPVGMYPDEASSSVPVDDDVQFIADILSLPEPCILPTCVHLDETSIAKRFDEVTPVNYQQLLRQYAEVEGAELVLVEGPGTLEEGRLFGLSLVQMAEVLDAPVVLVSRFHSELIVDGLLSAKERLGDRLLGVVINDIQPDAAERVSTQVTPFLEAHGIAVFGLLPRNNVLRSVSVRELVHQLNAEVLCRSDRLDLMVETLKIGAMNVNAALKYFRKAHNMAVVTGGDRTDIQLAALETSTHCLILTGQLPPTPTILSRAEDLEIPILSVDLDTLTTVEIIDRTFGQVRLHEPVKVQCVQNLMQQHFDLNRLLTQLGLPAAS